MEMMVEGKSVIEEGVKYDLFKRWVVQNDGNYISQSPDWCSQEPMIYYRYDLLELALKTSGAEVVRLPYRRQE